MVLLSVLRIRLPRLTRPFALFTLTLAALFAAFTPTAHALTASSTTLALFTGTVSFTDRMSLFSTPLAPSTQTG